MPDARLLIVEDEYLIRLLLEDMVAELGCSVAAIASSLAEAKSLAADTAIDLAILDVNVGGEHVFPVAEILKNRGVPFVFITGYGARGLPEAYREAPTLQKPFQMDELRAMLARMLPRL
jgi:DNA-binding response OmpR family regulator